MDNNKWHESSDRGGSRLFERCAGKFWLVAQQDDDEGRDWGAFVDVQERPTTRVSISESRGHSTREAAQVAAEAMLASLVAPLLATVRAEAALAEREACAAVAEHAAVETHNMTERELRTLPRRIASGIEARTAPAQLSAELLAAIAAARGLRLVDPAFTEPQAPRAKTLYVSCSTFDWVQDQAARSIATIRIDSPTPTGIQADDLLEIRSFRETRVAGLYVWVEQVKFGPPYTWLSLRLSETATYSFADVPNVREAVLAGIVAEAREAIVAEAREAIAAAAERRAEQLRTEELERGAFARAATFERAAELVAFAVAIRAESNPREPSRQAGAR